MGAETELLIQKKEDQNKEGKLTFSFANNPLQNDLLLLNTDEDEEQKKAEKYLKTDGVLKIIHAVVAGTAYAGFWALDAMGIPLLYYAFTDPTHSAYQPLQGAHLGVGITSMTLFSTLVVLGFVKMGLKLKNGYPLRKPHFAAAIVALSAYFLEIISLITSIVFFRNNIPGKEWAGLAHGIICGVSTLSITVSFITIFL